MWREIFYVLAWCCVIVAGVLFWQSAPLHWDGGFMVAAGAFGLAAFAAGKSRV
jgi:hypothetical protein